MILIRKQPEPHQWTLYRNTPGATYQSQSYLTDSLLKEQGYLLSGDLVLLTHGDELKEGGTNTCRILKVE